MGHDVELRFTGLRRGEKLVEELFFDAEHAIATHHPKVLRARHAALPSGLGAAIEDLIHRAQHGVEEIELRRRLKRLVPGFGAPSEESTPTLRALPALASQGGR